MPNEVREKSGKLDKQDYGSLLETGGIGHERYRQIGEEQELSNESCPTKNKICQDEVGRSGVL